MSLKHEEAVASGVARYTIAPAFAPKILAAVRSKAGVSVYITTASGAGWGRTNQVDHNISKVVSGIANTALLPIEGAVETVRILKTML